MKQVKGLLSLIMVVAILFASTAPVRAIGFDAEETYESVFVIYSGNSMGSGFAVGENCIVTNAHVIGNKNSITVETYGGTQYRASLLGMDAYQDIAVLIVQDAKFSYLEIADLSQMKIGDDIYTIGAPKGMTYTLTKGGVSAKEREINGQTYIQLDAPINEGNSGGPLLNEAGQVLGMNTLKLLDSEGIGLAIPITRVCKYLQSLGIQLNTNGNVEDRVDIPGGSQPSGGNPSDNQENNPNNDENKKPTRQKNPLCTPLITYTAIGVAAVSLIANIVLAVVLIKKRKKSDIVPYHPSERTDFDIEILE